MTNVQDHRHTVGGVIHHTDKGVGTCVLIDAVIEGLVPVLWVGVSSRVPDSTPSETAQMEEKIAMGRGPAAISGLQGLISAGNGDSVVTGLGMQRWGGGGK